MWSCSSPIGPYPWDRSYSYCCTRMEQSYLLVLERQRLLVENKWLWRSKHESDPGYACLCACADGNQTKRLFNKDLSPWTFGTMFKEWCANSHTMQPSCLGAYLPGASVGCKTCILWCRIPSCDANLRLIHKSAWPQGPHSLSATMCRYGRFICTTFWVGRWRKETTGIGKRVWWKYRKDEDINMRGNLLGYTLVRSTSGLPKRTWTS